MIETTSQGSFDHDQTKQVKHGGWKWWGGSSQNNLNWYYEETKFLVQIWAGEEI